MAVNNLHIVTDSEMGIARRWAAAKFEGIQIPASREPGLVILERGTSGALNLDANIEKNRYNRNALRLGEKQFASGLMIPSKTRIEVRLLSAGRKFSAVVGLEYADYTLLGKAAFIVSAGGREIVHQAVDRGYGPGIPIEADLGGAPDFIIEVQDEEGEWPYDHASWADAKIELEDGSVVMLGDLPIVNEGETVSTEPPFSFIYGGRPFSEIKDSWKVVRSSRPLNSHSTGYDITYTDPATGLEVRCKGVEYHDFPVIEWTLYFKNNGLADTPIIEDIRALDIELTRSPQEEFVLHHGAGCRSFAGDYEPFATVMKPDSEHYFHPNGGRATNEAWPYFNIEWPDEGMIAAVGWIAQWDARFTRDASNGLRVQAGQQITHFTLHPGEKVRSPLIALLFYKGEWVRSQNIWRRWLLAHNLPRIDGKLPSAGMFASSGPQTAEMDTATAENQIEFIDRYLEEKIPIKMWWMDAGWYSTKREMGAWSRCVGTWVPDPERFPNGLKEVSEHAHKNGLGQIVWFEPERVYKGSWLYENHPEWLLGGDRPTKLLNLGNPEARQWLTDHCSMMIEKEGIDVYRQDCNMDPLEEYWCLNEPEDRQGIAEIRHVEGLFAHWDELLRRHPKLIIDSVSSGHRRNDLEGLRRSISLTRTDYYHEPLSQQAIAFGMFFWMPYHAGALKMIDKYLFRSCFTAPHGIMAMEIRNREQDFELLRRLMKEWDEYSPLYFGDFYPLTSYSLDTDVWMAWQFDLPEEGAGMVQAFRRQDSPHESAHYRLRNLDEEAEYSVRNLDEDGSIIISGKELMENGLRMMIKERPGSLVFTYKRVEGM